MKLLLSVALFSIIFSAGFSQQNIASFREIGPTQALGDDIYFSATHEQYGVELFVNKGKSKINSLLKDINPGSLNSSPSELTIFNSQVYFIAYSSDYGGSVWKTDGTSEGTQLIYGVNNAHPGGLMVFKDKLYFRTDFGSIMRTDGTAAGTEVFYQSEYTYGRIQTVKADDQYIYFTSDGRTIYRDDGTSRINFLGPLSWEDVYYKGFFSLGNDLVVIKSSTYDTRIRIYAIGKNVVHDEGEDEWTLIKKLDTPTYGSQYIENFTIVGGKMFFNFRKYYDNIPPTDELWICDGTDSGTHMLKSFEWSPHWSNSHMGMFFKFQSRLFFRAGESAEQAIWISDGTTEGTFKFHDASIVSGYNDQRLPVLTTDDKFYFSGGSIYNAELWHSDGTPEGTKQLLDIEDAGSSTPHDLCFSNDILYFITSQQFSSTLWSTSPAPDISLWTANTAIPSGTSPTVFYNVPKGSCRTAEVVILNKGLSPLYLRSISITGRDFYLVEQSLPETLAPGQSVAIKIVFNPAANGKSEATLTILSNDGDEPRYIVQLQGNSSTSMPPSQVCQFPQNEYIKVLEAGEIVSSFSLSNSTVTERQPIGTEIGQFSHSTAAMFTLASGEGDADNGDFFIDGNRLKSNTVFNFNERTLYTIRVKATAAEGEFEGSFRIRVSNVSAMSTTGECGPRFQQMGFVLGDLESNAAGHLFVTTNVGKVLRSIDGGVSWDVVYDGDFVELATIVFKGNTGFISGNNVLLKSEDGGATWFRLYVPMKGQYYFGVTALSFFNNNEGYVGTERGEILFTKDGGRSWETRFQSEGTQFRRLYFLTPEKGYAITGYGDLEQTADGGHSWSRINLTTQEWNPRARDVFFISDEKGFLITDNNLYKTMNSGQSWTQVQDVSGTYAGRIEFFNESLGFVYGGDGFIYQTNNGGDSWHFSYDFAAPGRVVGLTQTSNKIFIASNSPYSSSQTQRAMSVSSDEGATWSNLNSYPGNTIYNVEFYTENDGIIHSENGLFRTDDNGITWTQSLTDITAIADILFVDANTALLVSNGNIYKSTDGGATTTLVLKTDTNEEYTPAGKLYAVPGNTLFSVSWYAMYRSDDLGESWTLVSTLPGYYTQGMHFISSSIGYRVELFGSIEKTVDGGLTWTEIFTRDPTVANPFNAVFFVDENVGYKGGDFLQRTSDGGYTWETVRWPLHGIKAIHFENTTHGYVVTRSGLVHESFDGGETWQTIFSASAEIVDVQFREKEIFLAGTNGFSARMNTTAGTPSIPGYIFGPDRICAGDAIDFRIAVQNSYQTHWTTTAENVEDRQDYMTVRFAAPGEYTITARHTNACGTSEVRTRTVTVSGQQSPPVIDGPDTAVKGDQDIAYTILGAADNASYLWSVEGGTATSSDDASILIDWTSDVENGEINVLQVDAAGCRAYGSLVVKLEVPLAIEDYLDKHIILYPNPSAADVRISSSYSNALIIRVLDVRGSEFSRHNLSPGGEQNLKTGNLSPGMYLIEISDGRHSITKKLIRK